MCILQKAALLLVLFFFLCPQLVRCLTLPENILKKGDLAQGRLSRNVVNRPALARVPEILEYSPEANALKFKISCDDCVDEEQKLLAEEVITIEVTPINAQSCSHTDEVGLRINGQDLRPNTGLTENIQSFYGPLTRSIEVRKSFLDRIRWTNLCGCPDALPGEDCGDDFESVLIFEVPGMRGTPGFTLSYKPYSGRRLLRVSNFPDTTLMSFPIIGRSLHWRSPLLQLQMGLMPTATLFSSFSSVFPSLTSSAASAAFTASSGHVNSETQPPAPVTTPPFTIPTPAASRIQASTLPTPLHPVLNVQGPGTWRNPVHISDGISAFEEKLTAAWHKAHDIAQSAVTSLHNLHSCSKDEAPQSIKAQVEPGLSFSADPSNTARARIPAVSSLAQQSNAFVTASSARDSHLTSKRAVIAFQLAALVTIIFVLCTAIFILIRRNPRLRADMAAQREERRNRRLFRRAACHYRWRKLLERFKAISGQCPTDNEKIEAGTTLPSNNNDDVLDSVEPHEKRTSTEVLVVTNSAGIRDGLRELRKAHRLVDGMVSAEEGRYTVAGRTTRHHRSWSDSASSEKTAPPPYEEEEVVVANGMRYVRYVRDTTPDSSVIATSPYSSVVDSDSESEKD